MAIIDKPLAQSEIDGEEKFLRHLHQHPEVFAHASETEPITDIEDIARLTGELVIVRAVAVRFISRLSYDLPFSQPRELDMYPTVIVDPGRLRIKTMMAFKYINSPPLGRDEFVTAFAPVDDNLAVWPIGEDIIR